MPNVPVAVGETWKTEGFVESSVLGGKYKATAENTLTEVNTENGRKIAVITSKKVGSSEVPKVIAGTEGRNTNTKFDFREDALVSIDLESGMFLKGTADLDHTCEVDHRVVATQKAKITVTVTPQ